MTGRRRRDVSALVYRVSPLHDVTAQHVGDETAERAA